MAAVVNPELSRARAQATFDPLTLTHFLDGGSEKTKRRRSLQNLSNRDFEQAGFKDDLDLTREEMYTEGLRRAIHVYNRLHELGIKDAEAASIYKQRWFQSILYPFSVHDGMFLPTLKKQGTEEQKKKWLPLSESYVIVGTYAQTELGHGTFLRGLETTATYDVKTREFTINSPTVTSAKFWPGGLGKTSNHCVVMARLKIGSQNCGVQSFIVPIRDVDTHQPLPGITVGDIGPKFGFTNVDNGFLRMDNVRIPRENMLMRYSQVLEDGTFVSPKNERLVYGTMTLIRTGLVGFCGESLAKASTITMRYSHVRRQSELTPGAGEVQVIDFQTQQHKVFTQVAAAYAMMFAGRFTRELYTSVTAKMETGQLDDLPVLHALTSALKAFCSWEMAAGMEQCRMSCGGHGYLMASGIPQLYADTSAACTYEGENSVLCLQAARFLNRCQEAANRGDNLPPMARFLQTSKPGARSGLTSRMELDQIISAYEYRAARVLAEANARLREELARGTSQPEAWNNASQLLVQASLAFSHSYVVRAFIETVSGAKFEKSLEAVMVQMAQLYGLSGIVRFSGDFTKDGYMTASQVNLAQACVFDLLSALKPNAVALVDAFDIPDELLGSALGRWDGNVYEAIMESASRSVLNKSQVHPAFYKFQKPFADSLKAQAKL